MMVQTMAAQMQTKAQQLKRLFPALQLPYQPVSPMQRLFSWRLRSAAVTEAAFVQRACDRRRAAVIARLAGSALSGRLRAPSP